MATTPLRQHANSPTESGETMKAAGLKAIATVVESTAVLIKSKHPSNQKLVNLIASRIRGVICKSFPPPPSSVHQTLKLMHP